MALKDGGGDVESQLDELDGLLDLTSEEIETAATSEGQSVASGGGGSSGAMFSQVVLVMFAVIAARRGEHWNLADSEAASLGDAIGCVVDKYAPSYQGGVEAALIISVLVVAAPRVMTDAKGAKAVESGAAIEKAGGESGDTSKSKPSK